MTAPRESGLYWWRDRRKINNGWTVVYVFAEGQTLRYTFLGTAKSVGINEIGSCKWGRKLTPPP